MLRFVAFLLVFLLHAFDNVFSGGLLDILHRACALGLCLFFLLSAYLITELLEREQQATHRIDLKAFYVRRMLRIWPLYFAFIFFDFVLQHHRGLGYFTTGRLVAMLLMAGNWYVVRHGFGFMFSVPLWSISVEEQFYVLWPSARKYSSRPGSIAFSIAMLAASFATLAWLTARHTSSDGIWTNSLVQFQFFSTGCLASLALRGRALRLGLRRRVAIIAAGFLCFAASGWAMFSGHSLVELTFPHAALGYLLANTGCVALLIGFVGAAGFGRVRPLVYLGKISYGLYVFHWMFLRIAANATPHIASHLHLPPSAAKAVQVLLALTLTIVTAALSYRFFESPILRFKHRFEVIRTRAV